MVFGVVHVFFGLGDHQNAIFLAYFARSNQHFGFYSFTHFPVSARVVEPEVTEPCRSVETPVV